MNSSAAITAGPIISTAASKRCRCSTAIRAISIRRARRPRCSRCRALQSYRGFVFASEAPDGPSLEEFLGYMTTSLDDMVDRAPDGEIEVAGGVFRHAYDGNWKLYLENLCDAAHPWFTHRSSIDAAQQQSDEAFSDGSGEIASPADAAERGAVQLLGIPGRHLDLPQRPFLSRRLSRRRQAGRGAARTRCSASTSRRWKRKRAKRRPAAFWKCGAGTRISIRTCRS